MVEPFRILVVVNDHLGHRDHVVRGKMGSGFHRVPVSRVCCHNKHITLVEPLTEHYVAIRWQILALPPLQYHVGDLLWQAMTVLPNGTAEVGVSIMQVTDQGEGGVKIVSVKVLVAHQVACSQFHDDVIRKSHPFG